MKDLACIVNGHIPVNENYTGATGAGRPHCKRCRCPLSFRETFIDKVDQCVTHRIDWVEYETLLSSKR